MRAGKSLSEKLLRLGTLAVLGVALGNCAGLSELGPVETSAPVPEMCKSDDGRILMGFSEADFDKVLKALERNK